MAIEKQEFRKVLGSFAAGVTVVTTVGTDGNRYGLTATAFTSVSLDPPLVLVCVDKNTESYPHLMEGKSFAVNFLSADQQDVSNRFAKSGGDKFEIVETRTVATGAPVLAGTLAFVDCEITERVEGGDHTIFIGRVEAAESSDKDPLVYFSGGYRALA